MKKEHLQTFDILHCHNPFKWYKPWRWLSLAIRSFQKIRFGKYAWSGHTAMIIVDSDGEVWVYEADPKVKKTKYEDWCRDIEVSITRYPIHYLYESILNRHFVFNYAESMLNTKYDFLGLIVWQPIYILTGKYFGKKDNGRYYCSEFVAKMINNFIGFYDDSYEINPSKLYCDMVNYEIYKGKAKDLV